MANNMFTYNRPHGTPMGAANAGSVSSLSVGGAYAGELRYAAGALNREQGMQGMGAPSIFDKAADFIKDPQGEVKKLTGAAADGLDAAKKAALSSGVNLSGDMLKALCDKMRPAAAAKLGKSVANTTDEDVLAYVAGIPLQSLTANLTAVAEEKANKALYIVAGVGVAIAAAIYFGMRSRSKVRSNGSKKRRRR